MSLNRPRFSANGTPNHNGDIHPPSTIEDRNQRTAEALAPRYEQLNRLWSLAETKLKGMQVPRYVWLTYKSVQADPEDHYSPESRFCLGLVRFRGDWRLCLGSYFGNDYANDPSWETEPTNWKPVSESSLEDRVEASYHISNLRERIVVSAEHYIAEVDKAIANLTGAIEQF